MNYFHRVYRNAEHFTEPKAPFIVKSAQKCERTDACVRRNRQWYNECFRLNCYSKFYSWTVSTNVPRTLAAYEAFVKVTLETCRNIKGYYYIVEKSSNGKLHLHGIVCSSDKSKFVKIRKNLLFHSEFKLISFYDGWLAYVLKESPSHDYSYVKY